MDILLVALLIAALQEAEDLSDSALQGGSPSELLDAVSLEDIRAVEVYTRASQLPAEYGGLTSNNCGVVLVWTGR